MEGLFQVDERESELPSFSVWNQGMSQIVSSGEAFPPNSDVENDVPSFPALAVYEGLPNEEPDGGRIPSDTVGRWETWRATLLVEPSYSAHSLLGA